jgi:hypothetical protein
MIVGESSSTNRKKRKNKMKLDEYTSLKIFDESFMMLGV